MYHVNGVSDCSMNTYPLVSQGIRDTMFVGYGTSALTSSNAASSTQSASYKPQQFRLLFSLFLIARCFAQVDSSIVPVPTMPCENDPGTLL